MPIEMNTGDSVAPPPVAPLWGAWSVRRSIARKMYDCHECGHLILRGDPYWRRFGRMGEIARPWLSRLCEHCEMQWRSRLPGDDCRSVAEDKQPRGLTRGHSPTQERNPPMTTQAIVKPAVLINEYPFYDSAGNKGQRIRVRYCCGHEKEWFSLDLGRIGFHRWKPQSNARIMREELKTTCPIAYRLCRDCAEGNPS